MTEAIYASSSKVLVNDGAGRISIVTPATGVVAEFSYGGYDAAFCMDDASAQNPTAVLFVDPTRKYIWLSNIDGTNLRLLNIQAADGYYLARPTMSHNWANGAPAIGKVLYTYYNSTVPYAFVTEPTETVVTPETGYNIIYTPTPTAVAALTESVISRDGLWIAGTSLCPTGSQYGALSGLSYIYGIGTDGVTYESDGVTESPYWRVLSYPDSWGSGMYNARAPGIDVSGTYITAVRFNTPYVDAVGQETTSSAMYCVTVNTVNSAAAYEDDACWEALDSNPNRYWFGHPCFWPDSVGVTFDYSCDNTEGVGSGTVSKDFPPGATDLYGVYGLSTIAAIQNSCGANRVGYFYSGGGGGGG